MDGIAARTGPRDMFSNELQIALAPDATFTRLLDVEAQVTWWQVLARPAMVILVIGIAVPIMSVQRVTLALVATSALSWSFVLAIQLLAGAAVIASAPARRAGVLRALDLWFAGHLPYSLWLLIVAAWGGLTWASLVFLVLTAVVPAVWTTIIVSAFCRTVLNATPSGARWRAVAHLMVVGAITLNFIAWSAGGWFNVVGFVWRQVGLVV